MPVPAPFVGQPPHPASSQHPVQPEVIMGGHTALAPTQVTQPVPESAQAPAPPPTQATEEVDPDVAAGYKDCLKETIRFLVEEEGLSPEHPVVEGLTAHLNTSTAHVELAKISQQFAEQSTPPPTQAIPRNAGYEITLVVDDDEEDDDEGISFTEDDLRMVEDMDLEEEEEIGEEEVREALACDPELQRQLLRFMYQGCNLVAGVQPSPPHFYPHNLPLPYPHPPAPTTVTTPGHQIVLL